MNRIYSKCKTLANRKLVSLVLACSIVASMSSVTVMAATATQADSQNAVMSTLAATATINSISLEIGANQTQRTVVFYSNSASDSKVQVALKSAMTGTDFPATYQEFAATSISTAVSGMKSFSATITGLAASTQYVYRVGNDADGWSDIIPFSTDSSDQSSFSFLAAGDPQIGSSGNVTNDTNGWTRTLNKVAEWFPNVNFMISLGDQVESATNESQFTGYLAPNYLRSLTLSTNIGNHDSSGANYKQHFNMPNKATNANDTTAGGDYWYNYNGVLFMSLNSNNMSTAQHKAFMISAIQAFKDQNGKDPAWKIVTYHHAVYSTASHTTDSDILQRRNELPVVFHDLGIDAALAGHDHVYTRSLMMDGTTPITSGYTTSGSNQYASYKDNPSVNETVYLTANSASGSKFYAIKNMSFPFKAVDNQENVPNITKIDVSSGAMVFTTYRTGASNTVNDVVDTFTLYRGVTPSITTASVAGGFTNTAYSQTVAATGDAPITYTVDSGALPAGLALDSASGAITGTPTAVGTFNFTVKAANIYGSDSKAYSIKIELLGNKTYLASEISKATGLTAALYTADSWSALQAALAQAQLVNNTALVSQDAVDQAFYALSGAIDGLVYAPNKTALKAAIDIAGAIKLANYSQASADAVTAALNFAVSVNSDATATQAQINSAYNSLMDTVLNLVLNQPDPDLLKAIAAGQVLHQSVYTSASWAVLDNALHNALLVVADPASTTVQISTAKAAILNAIGALVPRNDIAALKATVDKANTVDTSKFMAAQVADFQTALANATAVLNNDTASKTDIVDAINALVKAQDDLVLKANKDAIDALVAEINAIDQSKYTQDSINKIKALLAKVQTAGYEITATDFATIQSEYATAKAGLVLLTASNTGTGSADNSSTGNPKTGDNGAELWLILTAVCTGAVILVRSKKAAKR